MARFTPETVAEHPAFRSLVAIGLEVASAQSVVNKDTNRDQRRAYADRANALSVKVKSAEVRRDDRRAGELLRLSTADLGELLGISEADVRDLAARTRGSAKEFLKAFPAVRAEDERARVDVLTEAIKHDPAVVKAAGELAARAAAADGGESPATCAAICLAFYLTFLAAAIAMMIIGLVLCAGVGWIPPLAVLCVIGVIAAFVGLLAILTDLYLNCLANCVDAPWGD